MIVIKLSFLFLFINIIYSIECPPSFTYSSLSNICIYNDTLVSSSCQGTINLCDSVGNCDYNEWLMLEYQMYCPTDNPLIRDVTFKLSNPLKYYKCTAKSGSPIYWSFGKCTDGDTAEEKGSLTLAPSLTYLNILYCFFSGVFYAETSNSNSMANLITQCSAAYSYSLNLTSLYSCPIGYDSTYPCNDIDECATGVSGCSNGCINTIGGYNCTCPSSYSLGTDGKTCYPNNCLTNNGGCSDICVSENAAIKCSCPSDKILGSDSKTCYSNYCSTTNGGCSDTCIQNDSTYYCGCPIGKILGKDNKTCYTDLCSTNGGCSDSCIQNDSSYSCSCSIGKILGKDNKTCYTDLCSTTNGGCSNSCIQNDSTYSCGCPNNYQLESDDKTCYTISISSIIPSYTKGGDAVFIGSFGSVYNNSSLFIGGSECLIRNITPNQIVCNALPNTGVHSVTLIINGIKFIGVNVYQYKNEIYSCPNDCFSNLKQGICNTSTGQCNCNQPYSSFDCNTLSSNNNNNNNNNNEKENQITYNNTSNSFESAKLKFNIYYQSLLEVGIDGTVIKSYPLQKDWIVDNTNGDVLNFQQTVNDTQCKIITSIETIKDSYKEFTFASTSFKLERNSIKLTINISNYEFTNQLNSLQLKLVSSIDELNEQSDCNTKETQAQDYNDPSSIFTYIKISKNNQIFSARFLNRLLVDSQHETYFSITSENDNSTSTPNSITTTFHLPNFKSNVILDPDFSVLLSTQFKKCETNKSNNVIIIVAVVVPIVAIASIIVVSALIYKRSIFLKSKVSKLKLKVLSRKRKSEVNMPELNNK